MTVKAEVFPDNTLMLATYLTGALDSILSIIVEGGKVTIPVSGIGSLYPVVLDVNDDGVIISLEIFVRIPEWQIEANLELPKVKQGGRVVFTERDDNYVEPIFRLNPDIALLFIDAKPSDPLQTERHHIQMADKIIISLMEDQTVTGIWLLDIPSEVIEIGVSEAAKKNSI